MGVERGRSPRCGLSHLLDLWDLKERCEGCLDGSLGLGGQFVEPFSAMRTVFELSPSGFLNEPFSAVPTFDDRRDTHSVQFTSLLSDLVVALLRIGF